MKFVVDYYDGNDTKVKLIETDDPATWFEKNNGEDMQINAMVQVFANVSEIWVMAASNGLGLIVLNHLPSTMDEANFIRLTLERE